MMQKLFSSGLLIVLVTMVTLAQRNTVTNMDLEKYRQQRIQADADYELKVQSGKLPSKAELEKREQERQKFISDFSQKATAERNQAENYWQSQAYALRTEIAAVEAEANYVRARVSEIPQPQVYYSVGYLPYGYGGNCCYGEGGYSQFPGSGGRGNLQINNRQAGGRISIDRGSSGVTVGGGYGQTSIQQSSNFGLTNFNRPQTNLSFGGIPYQPGILTAPFTLQTPENFTREELISRLRLLEQQRAGLYARFEALQDEAQRNGVNVN